MSLPLLGAGMATDGLSAVLDLNFASLLSLTPSVGPTPSFTRASTGTYFNSSGVLTTAAINGPRFDHVYNGSSWVSKGLLIEEQRTNTATYSEDFSNAAWLKTTATISANLAEAPNGTTTADLCYPTSTGTLRGFYRIFSSAAVSVSVFAKSSGKTAFAFIASDGNTVGASFNLATGTVSNVFSGHTASIENCGGGWYRCKMVATTTAMQVFVQDAQGSSGTVTANSTDGVFFWGAQIETSTFPTSYTPTTTASVTRSADVCQITGTDFSGIWNLTAGSIVVDGDSAANPSLAGGGYELWSIHGTPTLEYYYRADNGYLVVENAVRKNVIAIPAANIRINTAIAFSASDFAASVNGAAVTTSSSLTMPVTPSVFGIGNYSTIGGFQVDGHIARLRYYNTRLLNSQLVALST